MRWRPTLVWRSVSSFARASRSSGSLITCSVNHVKVTLWAKSHEALHVCRADLSHQQQMSMSQAASWMEIMQQTNRKYARDAELALAKSMQATEEK